MQIVAITGPSGSGKSMVAQYYERMGYPSVDGDKISRDVCGTNSPCVSELADAFGDAVVSDDGTLKRQALADIAFATPESKKQLEKITHPYILDEIYKKFQQAVDAGAKIFFFEGAAIVGQEFENVFDKFVVVLSDRDVSTSRIVARDNISEASAQTRLDAQASEQKLLDIADYVIHNNGTVKELLQSADIVLNELEKEVRDY